jgi:hypothetical protein
MATRLYLTSTASDFAPGTIRGGWNDATLSTAYALNRAKNGANTLVSRAETSATATQVLLTRHVSQPLTGGVMPAITNPFIHTFARQSSATAANMTITIYIYFTVGDTDVVRGVWCPLFIGSTVWPITMTAFSYNSAGPTTAVTTQPGDRMVVEIGYYANNTVTTSYTGSTRIGGTSTTDLATTGTTGVSIDSPWIEFPTAMDPQLIEWTPQNYIQTPADTADAADSTRLALTKPITGDTAATSETLLAVQGRSVADTAAATDASSRIMAMSRAPADVAPIAENLVVESTQADIDNYQFVLGTGPYVPFGLGQTVVVENFDPGTAEVRDQDKLSDVGDYRTFGTDRRTPPVWSFDLYTDVETPDQALGWAQNLEEAWQAEELRLTPNSVTTLRYKIADRVRRVYGRPRHFDVVPNFVRTGRVSMVADFVLAEATYYDDAENKTRILTVPSSVAASGFTFPITFPLAIGAAGTSPRVETVAIGGRRPTWADVTFYGPSLDPWIEISGTRWALRGTLAAGQSARMSGKPWQAGVLRSDGAWVPGMLDPRARLSQLRLSPGSYAATYGAYDLSGSSYAEVAWRDAYGTM